jgi:hypothetical protein
LRNAAPLPWTGHGAIAQLGERLDRTQEAAGSSPASSIREVPANTAVPQITVGGLGHDFRPELPSKAAQLSAPAGCRVGAEQASRLAVGFRPQQRLTGIRPECRVHAKPVAARDRYVTPACRNVPRRLHAPFAWKPALRSARGSTCASRRKQHSAWRPLPLHGGVSRCMESGYCSIGVPQLPLPRGRG